MYAVIKTGGKQYRVQPGDLLVVEKIEADIGSTVSFDQVLMLGGLEGKVTVGAPLVDGAVVSATLIETRKGDKVHTVKKIRRQGHRRTKGHRQLESVFRITGLEGAGESLTWDGEVDMTPRSVLRHRARNLAVRVTDIPEDHALVVEEAAAEAEAPKAAKKPAAKKAEAVTEAPAEEVEAPAAEEAKPAPKKAAKPKAEAAPDAEATEAATEDKPAKPARAKKAAADDSEA